MDIEFGIDPEKDGIDHINVYSKGRTQLGRWMSNFTESPFKSPNHGYFSSIEGYWYWLKTGLKHDNLRGLSGYEAKKVGRLYQPVPIDEDAFKECIKEAMIMKTISDDLHRNLLATSTLPFIHYYVKNGVVIPKDGSIWQMDEWENIRLLLK